MSETTAKPRRRWFRFGLRTMFVVVTVFSVWLGWQAKIVRDRKEALRWLIDHSQCDFTLSIYRFMSPNCRPSVREIPFWRQWLGDEGVAEIGLHSHGGKFSSRTIQRLFPEAFVYDL